MTIDHPTAARYTSAEFEHAVLSHSPTVAVFDCDGTLWSGDAGCGFMKWSIDQGLVSRNVADWIDERYRLYLSGQVSEEQMCAEMVQMYAGLREDEMRHAAAEYFRGYVEPHIFAEMRSLIAKLQAAGTIIWAVSSTNNWVVEGAVSRFQIPSDHVVAAEVRVVEGQVTSELIDVPTDESKAIALRRIGLPNPDAVFGNSIHDEAMLNIAKHAYPVNPSPELLESAARRGWVVFYPDAVFANTTA